MKKFLAIGLAAVFALTMLAGCGGNGDNGGNGGNKNNTEPIISGVPESATVMAGEEWDALKGVTASDKEDGDLTDKIEVSARGLTFTDGKTTPTEARESSGYQVRYTVKDSGGLEAEEFCVLYVKQAAAELVTVYEADFSDVTPKYDWAEGSDGEGNNHRWNLVAEDGAEATAALKEGRLAVDVTNRNNAGDDKLMLTRGFEDLPVGTYKFAFWAKATPDVKVGFNALLNDASLDESKIADGDDEGDDINGEKWDAKNLGGGKYSQDVTSEYKVYTLDFEIKADVLTQEAVTANKAKVLFRICLGGNDNANAFKFDVEKIIIWKTTGVEKRESLVSHPLKGDTDGLFGTDEAVVTQGADGAKIAVAYPTESDDWRVKATIGLGGPDVVLEKDAMYYYTFKVTATNKLHASICVEQNDMNDAHLNRASYTGIDLTAGETKTVNVVFKMGDGQQLKGDTLSDAVCRLYLGVHDADVTTNQLTISDFDFGTVSGDQVTSKIEDKFILFGAASPDKTNPDYPISVYNQSDDVFDAAPSGTAYFENGKLVYLIHQGGSDWGHNKLAFGFPENPIGPLPANAYYVISFKIKASVALDFALTLHELGGSWDEASGSIPIRYADFGGHETLHASTEEKEIVVTSNMLSLTARDNWELLLEFGKSLGDNKEVKIEISDLTIGYRAVQE